MHEHQDQERALTASLRQIAVSDATAGASAEVRSRLLDEVRAIARERRRALMKTYALAAGLLIATALPVWHLTTRPASDVLTRTARIANDIEVFTMFYPLTYSDIPVTQGSVVRLEVSPAAFAALGVEPVEWAGPQPDVVLADVLVGEDGLARAVRFVRTVANGNLQEGRP
jgi:hypothetical protein